MSEETVKLLWDYYKMAAEVLGRERMKKDEESRQAKYSLLEFYRDEDDNKLLSLNDLTRAFLGDREANSRLLWNEEIQDNVEEYFLEGENNSLNESQRAAVKGVLGQPVSFIQGPPGTGKTITILNLASCITGMGKTAAIVSGNNKALETVCKRVDDFKEREETPNRRRVKEKMARLGNQTARKKFIKEHDLSDEEVNGEYQIKSESFLETYSLIISTINSLKNCFAYNVCYDYVLVDETSQVDTVKGILAMSSARHLVLVGDEQQLPPVLNREKIEQIDEEWKEHGKKMSPELCQLYKMQEERSFLDVCLEVFQEERKRFELKFFLKEHYRCHPGIIDFCKREIYDKIYETKLEIKTKEGDYDNEIKVPIKVLWFEGDYCEGCKVNKRRSKRNRKQADIFMAEEFPDLLRRMESEEEKSLEVCILSPFRGQLEELKERIEKYNEENNGGLQVVLSNDRGHTKSGKEEDFEEERHPMLTIFSGTIHKAQSDEFDIVYLLPVEDGEWEWPWSQRKRLVNVAASRAKKELRLIVSSVMMSPELQEKLTGRPVKEVSEKREGTNADDQMFIQKLADYVKREGTKLDREKGFGFHQTRRRSLFDLGHWKERQNIEKNGNGSSSELCVWDAIREMPLFLEQGLELYRNVKIRDIQDETGHVLDYSGIEKLVYDNKEIKGVKEYIEQGAEFDFVVCKEGRILLAIEVDGTYHRFNDCEAELSRRKDADTKKDALVEEFFHGKYYKTNNRKQEMTNGRKQESSPFAFIRLPADGSTYLETRELWEKAEKTEQEQVFPLEELLEKQLDNPEGLSYRFVPRTLTNIAKYYEEKGVSWTEQCEEGVRPVEKLRELLLEAGYLELEDNQARATKPTEKGIDTGIVTGCRINDRGKSYITSFYSERAVKSIPMRLEANENRKRLERLMHQLYDRFEEFVRSLEMGNNGAGIDLDFRTLSPDYSNIHVQELYLLRFLSAYACEYTRIYEDLLSQGLDSLTNEGDSLEIMTIGCGNMVDYWGVSQAFMKKGKNTRIGYLGIDKTNWEKSYRISARKGDLVNFLQQDAAIYLREQKRINAGLIVFSKSVSEFSDTSFEDICKSLQSWKFSRDRIGLLMVFRSNGDGPNPRPEDKARWDELISSLEKAGFEKQKPEISRVSVGKEEKIWETDKETFSYMKILNKEIVELFQRYDKIKSSGEESRKPIVYTYISYWMVILEKGGIYYDFEC